MKPPYEMYGNRELTDVVLRVGETRRAAHRVVLATVSPYLRKMFGSGMAESKSREIELQDVSELALPALVEFSYTAQMCSNIYRQACAAAARGRRRPPGARTSL